MVLESVGGVGTEEANNSYHSTFDDETEVSGHGGTPLVRALERGLRILRYFDCDHPKWSIAELSRQSGMHKATVHRFIKTLESEGFISHDASTGEYSLGPAVFQMAYVWHSNAELARIATPHMEALSALTGESVALSVWSGEGVLFVAQVLTSRVFKPRAAVGVMFTDLANAHSKILLAFGPESRRRQRLARGQEPLTPFTVTDPDRLEDELRRVAVEGVAYDIQGQHLGMCAVAVPVRDFSGEVRASISVSTPAERFGPAEMKSYYQALTQTASALSYDLGYRKSQIVHKSN